MSCTGGAGKVESYRCAVHCVLDNWQALSMAVEHSFGGQYSSEKAEWLKGVVCEFLTSEQSGTHIGPASSECVAEFYPLCAP